MILTKINLRPLKICPIDGLGGHMKKEFIITLFGIVLLSACSGVKTRFENDPTFTSVSGPRVFVEVLSADGKPLGNKLLAKSIKAEAFAVLKQRGFQLVDHRRQADTGVLFSYYEKGKTIYVPGETYSLPVYGSQGTVSTLKGQYGQTLGTISTEPSNPWQPTGYQTHYREGYNQEVTDRSLNIWIFKLERGHPPEIVANGQAFPKKYSSAFLEDNKVRSRAVKQLIGGTYLGNVKSAPQLVENSEPGCWLGIGYVLNDKSEAGEVKEVEIGSPAEKAGLKKGDTILTIGGMRVPANTIELKEKTPVEILVERNNKRLKLKVTPEMMCLED